MIIAGVLALLAFTAPFSVALADQTVTLDQVPAKARQTIQNEVGNGRITEIDREKEKNRTVYEVEYTTADGVDYEIDVAEDGTLLGKERE
jgi:uncharacterized membrane protein YkoI